MRSASASNAAAFPAPLAIPDCSVRKNGQCSIIDMSGTCAKVPRFCTRIFKPVCGCDGKTYGNDCERQVAMVSKNHNGKCRY